MVCHLETGTTLPYTPNIYNKSRLEILKDAYRHYLPLFYDHNHHHMREGIDYDNFHLYCNLVSPHQMPGAVHFLMFIKYLEAMGTE
jgi:hypothetical protein